MRLLCVLATILIATAATVHAAAWKNETFGCQANLPDSAGWLPIEAPSSANSTVLVAMHHAQKGSAFGVNVVHDLPSANLRDPATVAAIEKTLQTLGYQFIGKSTVGIGGREWLQYPVRSATYATTGVMRYTAANNQVYVVSLLRTGGREAAQDTELQMVAASVRIQDLGPAPLVATAPPTPAPTALPAPSTPAPATVATKKTETASESEEGSVKIGPVTLTREQLRMGLFGVGGLIVLLVLLKIMGGGGKSTPTQRR